MSADADAIEAETARTAAAESLRDLVHSFVRAEPANPMYTEIQTRAAELVGALEAAPRRDRMALMQAERDRRGGGAFPIGASAGGFNDRAVAGRANPGAIDVEVDPDGDEVVAHIFFRKGFEGPPGRTHGGIVAAAFDDVTGFIIGRIGQPAFTGELTVRFVNAVPIETPIEMRARLVGQERRKLFISAEATANGVVVATCKAIYITIDPSVFAAAPDPR